MEKTIKSTILGALTAKVAETAIIVVILLVIMTSATWGVSKALEIAYQEYKVMQQDNIQCIKELAVERAEYKAYRKYHQ